MSEPLPSALPQLLPAVDALPRADKFLLMQHLVVELAREEKIPLLEMGASYPLWTPLEAYDAAAVLTQMLEAERAAP